MWMKHFLVKFKTGFRKGDAAELGMIEFVDFNEVMLEAKPVSKKRRGRRGGAKKATEITPATATSEEE